VAAGAAAAGAKLVYISTDYVFDGQGEIPFETGGKTAPLNVYGKSKLAGEMVCRELCKKLFIVRTSWVFGKNGANFVKTMLRLSGERGQLSVVNDQTGSPTYTVDLADFIAYIIRTDKFGAYHFSNEGFCSWFEFAKKIIGYVNKSKTVNPISTASYVTAAIRPSNSRLSKKSVYDSGYKEIPSWQNALERYMGIGGMSEQ
jgi:dTDP-4-dehydrorhamnose reductase